MVELVAQWAAQPPERREAFLQEHLMAGICDQLRRAISKSGETYYALAQRSGVDAVVISRFVNSERDLRLETAEKLAAALGLELHERKRSAK
jgi:ribosome-binding protein aMBF1 (putative translation factor)